MKLTLHTGRRSISLAGIICLACVAVSGGGTPALTNIDITALVLTNEISESWTKEGFAAGPPYDEALYLQAIADCDSNTPTYSTEIAPACWQSAYASCIWFSGWEAMRVDKRVEFYVDLRGLTNSQYSRFRQEFRVTRGSDGMILCDYGKDLPKGSMEKTDTPTLSVPWGIWRGFETAMGTGDSFDVNPPVVWAEIETAKIVPVVDPNAKIQDPVNAISGAVTVDEPDLFIGCPGLPLEFRRSYGSQLDHKGVLGNNWLHNYEISLSDSNTVFNGVTNAWKIMQAGAEYSYWFKDQGSNAFESPFGYNIQLVLTNDLYQVRQAGGVTLSFATNGHLVAVSDAWLNTISFTYTNLEGKLVLCRAEHGNGQGLDFEYESNLLARVSSPSTNLSVCFGYNINQELTNALLVSSSGQFSTRYAYTGSTNGNEHCLTQRVDAAGQVMTWNYATNADTGALISKAVELYASSNLAKARFNYSSNENFTAVVFDRDGVEQAYEYRFHPVMKVLEEVRGPNVVATNWFGTGKGIRTAHDYSGDCTNTTVYDYELREWARLAQQYDAAHRLTNMAFGYLSEPTNAWKFTWDTNWNLLASATDPEGNRAEWDYTNGNVHASRVFPQPGQTAVVYYAYTSNGVLASVTNANGSWAGILSDVNGNPTQVVTSAGVTNWLAWDNLSHLASVSRPSTITDTNDPPNMIPISTAFDVDELGWTRKITYPDSSCETFGFNAVGKLTNHVDTAGRTNAFSWLPTGKLGTSTRYLFSGGSNQAATITADYDQQMNALQIKDELGRAVESYTLDLQDRPVCITNLEGQVMAMTWGLGPMLKSLIRFDGTTNTMSHDSAGRISRIEFPDDAIELEYYKNGLPKTIGNSQGMISNGFAGASRLTSQRQPVPSGNLDYSYYPAGQVSNVVSIAGTNTWILDAGDRIQTLAVSAPDGQDSVIYSRDPLSGVLTGAGYSNGLHCAYSYDLMDRVTGISWTDTSNRVIRSRFFTYTPAGLISNITFETGERALYSYDSLDRLTREKHVDWCGQVISDERYEYDLAGNRTRKTILDGDGAALVTVDYSLAAGNRLGSWTVAETNLAARFSVVGSSSDPIGVGIRYGTLWVSNAPSACVTPYVGNTTNFYAFDLICGMGTQYVHAAIRDLAGNTSYATNRFYPTCVTNGIYQYSAAGCLTNREYSGQNYAECLGLSWNGQYQLTAAFTNGSLAESFGYDGAGRRIFIVEGGATNWMVYDGDQVVAEVDDAGSLKKSYVYEGLDRAVSMTTYGAATNTYYFIRDHLGSTLALTDQAGNVVEGYRYDAWGRVLGIYNAAGNQIDASAVGNRILWQGREYSWKTSLYYFRARWYDPITGRWLSNDPIGISGGLNQYVFCANNPVNFRDPFGLCKNNRSIYDLLQGYPWAIIELDWRRTLSGGGPIPVVDGIPRPDLTFKNIHDQEWGRAAPLFAISAIGASTKSSPQDVPIFSRSITGRGPVSVPEQMTMRSAMAGKGRVIMTGPFGDPSYQGEGWVKMQVVSRGTQGNITVHYMRNVITGQTGQYKFVTEPYY